MQAQFCKGLWLSKDVVENLSAAKINLVFPVSFCFVEAHIGSFNEGQGGVAGLVHGYADADSNLSVLNESMTGYGGKQFLRKRDCLVLGNVL